MKTSAQLTARQKKWLQLYIEKKAAADGFFSLDKHKAGKWRHDLQNDKNILRRCGDSIEDKYIKDSVLNSIGKSVRSISEADVHSSLNLPQPCRDVVVRVSNQESVAISLRSSSSEPIAILGIGTVETWGTAVSRVSDATMAPTWFRGIILSSKGKTLPLSEIDRLREMVNALGLELLVVHPLQVSSNKILARLGHNIFSQIRLQQFSNSSISLGYEFD